MDRTADPLVHLAKVMDFHTVVVDARKAFATMGCFPHADELVYTWPAEYLEQSQIDGNTATVTLTHDEQWDIPARELALRSPAVMSGR